MIKIKPEKPKAKRNAPVTIAKSAPKPKGGRAKVHASDADRQRAYRTRKAQQGVMRTVAR